jgi:hypothetical protein
MQYFSTLPKAISVKNGNSSTMTNLLARSSIIQSLLTNSLVFYNYDIQDGDTPETVAYKYYGDVYRYWIVLFSNQMLDPQWDWPLNTKAFQDYIVDKYQDFNPYSTIQSYTQTTTQFDFATQTTTVNTVTIDQNAYNTFVPYSKTVTLPTGPVSITKTVNAISYYDYEMNLNESKRNISLLNNEYVSQIEGEFSKLMAQ